jgi:spore photoproduct lyase
VFRHIYIENSVAEHLRTQEICARFPQATRVYCERYGEIFNPKSQDFRLQKARPALILAGKHGNLVLETPPGYGIGGERNYYFSHMLNCLYDCRYCFLQGMYRSANYVLFVNYESFEEEIIRLSHNSKVPVWFFSGYDCDSLVLEPVSGFAAHFLRLFAGQSSAFLELRTKSTQIRALLNRDPLDNVVVAFSLTPREMHRSLEHRVPSVERRLDAMEELQQSGWLLGVRFDPLIYQQGYQAQYRTLFSEVFSRLDANRLHSVSLGLFRLPRGYFRTIARLYPEEPLFAGPLAEANGMVSYRPDLENELTGFCCEELRRHVPESLLFPCPVAA